MIAEMIKTLQEMQEKYGDIEVKAYITDGIENEYLLDIFSLLVADFEDKITACVAIQIKKDGN